MLLRIHSWTSKEMVMCIMYQSLSRILIFLFLNSGWWLSPNSFDPFLHPSAITCSPLGLIVHFVLVDKLSYLCWDSSSYNSFTFLLYSESVRLSTAGFNHKIWRLEVTIHRKFGRKSLNFDNLFGFMRIFFPSLYYNT